MTHAEEGILASTPPAEIGTEAPSTPPAEIGTEAPYDISSIIGTVKEYAFTSSREPDSYCSVGFDKALTVGDVVIISGARSCEGGYPRESVLFYEIVINGKPYFIEQSNVTLTEADKKRLDAMPTNMASDFKEKATLLSLSIRQKHLEEAIKALEKTSKHGLTLLKHKIYDTSEYTEGTGFSVIISNPTKKTIKYISFTIVGYNSVNDPVLSLGKNGASITVRGVGPIEPDSTASYDWEYLWLTDQVQTHKITSIKIEYMDKSIRTLKNIKDITLAPEHYLTITEE